MVAKPLTYDQKKAAEAAFRGLPLDPAWSAAARAIYEGIVKSTQGRTIIDDPELSELLQKVAELPIAGETTSSVSAIQPTKGSGTGSVISPASSMVGGAAKEVSSVFGAMTRAEAVRTGVLVDVTDTASQVGISLPVGLTKPMWEVGITAGDQIPEEQQQGRVRDLMVALRLFLEQANETSPLMEFSALLAFPPDPVPQVCPLFVLAHREDSSTPYSLTVLLPREISLIKILPGS